MAIEDIVVIEANFPIDVGFHTAYNKIRWYFTYNVWSTSFILLIDRFV